MVASVEYKFDRLSPMMNERLKRWWAACEALAIVDTDDALVPDLKRLIEPATRGEPTSPLLSTSKSTRHLASELGRMGHQVSYRTVSRILEQMGYSLQANRKTEKVNSIQTGVLNSSTSTNDSYSSKSGNSR